MDQKTESAFRTGFCLACLSAAAGLVALGSQLEPWEFAASLVLAVVFIQLWTMLFPRPVSVTQQEK